MNNLNTYDILEHALKYNYAYQGNNPIAKFEYILNNEQFKEAVVCLQNMNISHTSIDETGKNRNDFIKIDFLNCMIILTKK